MNVLSMGLPWGHNHVPIRLFRSQRGHEVRVLSPPDGKAHVADADYFFGPRETVSDIVARIAPEWRPDMLICWLPELAPPPRGIEDAPIRTVAVVSDWNLYYPQLKYNLARYDVVLTDRQGCLRLRPPHAQPRYLFPVYSHISTVHRPMDVPRDIDIVFVGNLNHAIHVRRARLLEKVASLADRYRVVVAAGAFMEDYARLLNRARIVFNHSVRQEMNLRCFETVACGSLLFLEDDNLEAPDWLRDRVEAVYYNEDNVLDLLAHYLEHEEERAAIAAQGHARAAELAGEARMDALIDWLAEQPWGERGFRALSDRERSYAEMTQVALFELNAQARAVREELDALSGPDFLTLRATLLLEEARETEGDARKALMRRFVETAREACAQAPDATPLWLNLAMACSLIPSPKLEAATLEQALKTASCAFGNLLMGHWTDPQHVAWRKACALGEERVELLWAMAATRLARLHLANNRPAEAETWAGRAIDWNPDAGEAWALRGEARHALGRLEDAAADIEACLSYTAFDADHREMLIALYRALGRTRAALALARDSARLFTAWPQAAGAAERFRRIAEGMDVDCVGDL